MNVVIPVVLSVTILSVVIMIVEYKRSLK